MAQKAVVTAVLVVREPLAHKAVASMVGYLDPYILRFLWLVTPNYNKKAHPLGDELAFL